MKAFTSNMLWFWYFSTCLSAVCGQTLDNDHADTVVQNTDRDIMPNVQRRLVTIESQHADSLSRIAVLEEQQQHQLQIIAELVNYRQTDKQRISDLENHRENDQRHIYDLENSIKFAQRQISEFSKYQNIYKRRITNFEKRRDNDLKRITNLEKLSQNGIHRMAAMEIQRKNDRHQVLLVKRLLKQLEKQTMNDNLPDKQKDALSTDSVPMDKIFSWTERTQMKHQPMTRVTETKPTVIAFRASLSHDIDRASINMPIQFDQISLNVGRCYSGNTGVFTCTSPGIYMFSWTVQIHTHMMYTELVRNGGRIAVGYAGDTSYDSAGTGVALIELNQGDEVLVRVHSFNHVSEAGHMLGTSGVTSFSGFQVQ
ncbi:uncharacterized protein LOC110449310 [Mizuhopecten yessoensis]|uniref:Caprin-2 n=1 Tax=Mizuhopecten yessoensis TaxID=6573 RepID=A0A210QRG8_MIZYE|nr:uncharacterized protein LOC110449310 [Mizuhopecten yessoensis]OWF51340.1 Caprin-2 [Mizuhopecten yessoensis]